MLRKITINDYEFASRLLPRLKKKDLEAYVAADKSFVILNGARPVGILLSILLWERIPFLEHLIIEEESRGQGFGSQALKDFEAFVKAEGHPLVLLSTQADEKAQCLYRRLGYVDNGALFMGHTPYPQPAEIFLYKNLI